MLEIPQEIYDAQKWGGEAVSTGAGSNSPFVNVIRVQLPPKYSRDWVLSLNAPFSSNGFLLENVGIPAPTTWPDTDPIFVKLVYGHGGGSAETVVMDYPSRGASYIVSGNYVEVSIKDGNLLPLTDGVKLQASLVPASTSRMRDYWGDPTYTMKGTDLAAGGFVRMAIPRRARYFTFKYQASGAVLAPAAIVSWFNNAAIISQVQYQTATSRNSPEWPYWPLPVPRGVNNLGFVNVLAAAMTGLRFEWGLSL
jgi:hypothetical protein